jgi:hypothetical protein
MRMARARKHATAEMIAAIYNAPGNREWITAEVILYGPAESPALSADEFLDALTGSGERE